MDYDIHAKLKKGNVKGVELLMEEYLRKAWFLSYELTGSTGEGAPLLIRAWNVTIAEVAQMREAPDEDFRVLLNRNLLKLYLEGVESDPDFESLPVPEPANEYLPFVKALETLPEESRTLYLMSTHGNLGTAELAERFALSVDEVTKRVKQATEFVAENSSTEDRKEWVVRLRLAAEFKGPSDSPFREIEIPEFLLASLVHEMNGLFSGTIPVSKKESGKREIRKEAQTEHKKERGLEQGSGDSEKEKYAEQKSSSGQSGKGKNKNAGRNANAGKSANQGNRTTAGKSVSVSGYAGGNRNGGSRMFTRKKNQLPKIIAISTAVLVVILFATLVLPRILRNSSAQVTSITTYHVEAVTYGDVTTTISGSGSLTPVSKDTLTTMSPCTVTAVNYEVGDEVEEEAIIATVTDAQGNEIEFTAPYDCVLLELPIAEEDDLSAGSEIAMVMGMDGYTMSISVDELDISTVKVGQEVSFTINAVSGEYTGSVSTVSYNGTSSGGTTVYRITAKVGYVEGVYPGMTASAEIVIESSGDGLLVPVEAVRTSGDDNYVYLAPSGAVSGEEYDEDEIDVSDLTKVIVETGMSDGSYILIESDELAEDDLILIQKLTSTQTGSLSDTMGNFGGRGGFPGGMNFGDMDFENMDFSNMPMGGFGGMGGY